MLGKCLCFFAGETWHFSSCNCRFSRWEFAIAYTDARLSCKWKHWTHMAILFAAFKRLKVLEISCLVLLWMKVELVGYWVNLCLRSNNLINIIAKISMYDVMWNMLRMAPMKKYFKTSILSCALCYSIFPPKVYSVRFFIVENPKYQELICQIRKFI